MVRSVLSIVIGYLVYAVPSVLLFRIGGIDPHAPAPSGSVVLLCVAYGVFFALLAGWLTVRLVGRRVLWPVLTVAALVVVLAAVSLAFAHDVYWTQLSALILVAPAVVVGGAIRLRNQR